MVCDDEANKFPCLRSQYIECTSTSESASCFEG